MTTFQDPPPQSRRAARESERAAHKTDTVDYAAFLPPAEADAARQEQERALPAPGGRRAQRPAGDPAADLPVVPAPVPAEPLTYSTQVPSYDGPSFARTRPVSGDQPEQAPAAESPDPSAEQAFRIRDYSPEGGRRASTPTFTPPPAPADLDYQTAAAPAPAWQPAAVDAPALQVPPAQPMTRRELRAMQAAADAAAAATPLVEPAAESASAAALAQAIAEFEALAKSNEAAAAAPTALLSVVAEPAEAEPVADEPVADEEAPATLADFGLAPVDESVDAEPTDDESGAEPEAEPEPTVEPALFMEPEAFIEPSPILDAAEPAPFPFALTSSSRSTDAEPVAVAEDPFAVPSPSDDEPIDAGDSMPAQTDAEVDELDDEDVEPFVAVPEPVEASIEPEPIEAAVVEAEAIDDAADDESTPVEAVVVEESPVGSWLNQTESWSPPLTDAATTDFTEPPVVRESYTPPVGHWSRQADLEDEMPFENTLSREVGGSNISTTTSALILPSIPQSDFSGLINGTGEILITGTIDLPHGLSTMGADSRHFDNSEVDHMFEAADKELVSNDSQPVRAIRAVSTHTATRGVIQINTKPHSNRLLTVAIVTACVLAAAVVGLLAFYVITSMGS